jgi:hypothetical protein
MSNVQIDKLNLIDYSIKVVETLLLEYQEYFPCATTIDLNGKIVPVSYFDGDEHLLSADLITKYKEILDEEIRKKVIRAYSIAYDVIAQKHKESEKTDAIAILIKHSETKEMIVYFYAYKLTSDNTLVMGDCWGVVQD